MPKPTERAIKRKPMAVVMLTVERSNVNDDGTVKMSEAGYDFEWFETEANREKFFDQVNDFDQDDAKNHDDLAYLLAVITDTANMTLGRVEVAPKNPSMTKWKNAVKKDPTLLFAPVTKKAASDEPKKAVKPRGKTAAAKTEVKKGAAGDGAPKPRAVRAKPTTAKAGAKSAPATPTAKAADLRKKLAAKKGTTQAEAEVAALDEALKKG